MDREFLEEYGIVQGEDETELAFRAFRAYLQSPAERRSLRNMVDDDWSFGSLSAWSARYDWQARAKKLDTALAEDGLNQLLGVRQGLIVKAILDSIDDSQRLREIVMRQASMAGSDHIASLVSSRIEIDAWRVQIQELLTELGGRYA